MRRPILLPTRVWTTTANLWLGAALCLSLATTAQAQQLWASGSSMPEGGRDALRFFVFLENPPMVEVRVDYDTVDGTATAPDDYLEAHGTLLFPPGGATLQFVDVPVTQDPYPEGTESVSFILSNPVNATLAQPQVTVGIEDSLHRVLFVDDAIQDEGATSLAFRVSLSEPSSELVSFDYETVDGSAHAGADYTAVSGSAFISPGSQSVTIEVPVLPDSLPEKDEAFFLRLSDPIQAGLGDPQGRALIADDDSSPASVASLPSWGLPVLTGLLIGLGIKTVRRPSSALVRG